MLTQLTAKQIVRTLLIVISVISILFGASLYGIDYLATALILLGIITIIFTIFYWIEEG